ncbi:MAG: L-2-amino-thiazoline-4-carboxylic acid hydrolase [Theionarchaea archaeon]|nr:L-2-amino-thiazoline-4-carboxylic acid hydrolase [Theionarchaea archaeon]MBU7036759.1 L-2-amino-thiazoline-4-carboxylic acid hydrolase [Theionarchaea archaeon]
MKAILVLLEGTICDTRPRHHLGIGTPEFYQREEMLKDPAVPGSVQCLQELSQSYAMVYLGARPASTLQYTEEWLKNMGFPEGPVYLGETHEERRILVRDLKEKFTFIAGIGDRWDDNEYHTEIGCLSIILEEFRGNWAAVPERITTYERNERIKNNEIHLKGKVEGLSRTLPLLHSKYGDEMWETYFDGIFEMFENSRETRRKEDLESLAENGFNPADLRDVAKWYDKLNKDWRSNPIYGLQEPEIEATESRCTIRVSRCRHAELWKECGHPEIGYQIHCRPDRTWLDRPAWNPKVRFEQPKTLMQGDDSCLFILYLPEEE